MTSSEGDNGGDRPVDGVPAYSGDSGESRHSRDEHIQRDSHFRDESLEYLGTVRKELRRILPNIPDLTLLMWSGENV